MKLVTTVRLNPTHPQILLGIMEQFNRACNALSEKVFETQTFHWLALQRAHYHWLRSEFGLTAAQAVVAVRKVAYAYSDKTRRDQVARFTLRGAIPVYRHAYKRDGTLVLYGLRIPFQARTDTALSSRYEAKLAYHDGTFILYQVYEREEPAPSEPDDWLGCDLGIVNLLTDSDGVSFSGGQRDDARRKYHHRRRNLQRKGTRSTHRKLRKLSGRQALYQRDINHQMAKQVVAKAQATRRGIALEDLQGIRQRITVSRRQRARQANWSFSQLRFFVEYKAALAGIPVRLVDPRHTSQTCPVCGHVARENRPCRSRFRCVSCGFAGAADAIAARNIRARARGDAPMVAAPASNKYL